MPKDKLKRVSARDARRDFAELMGRAAYGNENIIIQRNGKDMVALISVEELQRLRDLEDWIDNHAADKAFEDYEKHGGVSLDEVKKSVGF